MARANLARHSGYVSVVIFGLLVSVPVGTLLADPAPGPDVVRPVSIGDRPDGRSYWRTPARASRVADGRADWATGRAGASVEPRAAAAWPSTMDRIGEGGTNHPDVPSDGDVTPVPVRGAGVTRREPSRETPRAPAPAPPLPAPPPAPIAPPRAGSGESRSSSRPDVDASARPPREIAIDDEIDRRRRDRTSTTPRATSRTAPRTTTRTTTRTAV